MTALTCSRSSPSNHSMMSSMLAPASIFSKIAATGIRVPRSTHAPLTLPGTRSTAGHCDQSRLAITRTPGLQNSAVLVATAPSLLPPNLRRPNPLPLLPLLIIPRQFQVHAQVPVQIVLRPVKVKVANRNPAEIPRHPRINRLAHNPVHTSERADVDDPVRALLGQANRLADVEHHLAPRHPPAGTAAPLRALLRPA